MTGDDAFDGPNDDTADGANDDTSDDASEAASDVSTDDASALSTDDVPDAPLAAIVEQPRAEIAIESLRDEGIYDDSRRVRAYGDDAVALPICSPPAETPVREVVRQVDPDPRAPDLEDLLCERGWSDADLSTAPGSWAVIGDVILVNIPEDCPDETAVAEALLELHGGAESVLADEGIASDGTEGTHREPRTRHLAGARDTETIHTEAGTRYALDPSTVMFAPGNQAERVGMGEAVSPDEHVLDMFAGIGYFTLPMARAGARVTACEVNPTAFRYLLENAVLNGVQERVDAYRADCRDVAGSVRADRVVMGYYGVGRSGREGGDIEAGTDGTHPDPSGRRDEAHGFLEYALDALVPGGVVHYHEATPESLLWDRPLERLRSAVEEAGRTMDVLDRRRVKSHSPGVWHVVVDVRVA